MDLVSEQLAQTRKLLEQLPREEPAQAIKLLRRAYDRGHQIFVISDEASALTASHSASDLSELSLGREKRPFTATYLSRDEVAERLVTSLQPGDIVIGFSIDGKAAGVIDALRLAKSAYALTIGFAGFKGGELKSLTDICIAVPSEDVRQIQYSFQILIHAICIGLQGAPTSAR